jgi:hypothetical protein
VTGPTFYRTRRFSIMFTRTQFLTLSLDIKFIRRFSSIHFEIMHRRWLWISKVRDPLQVFWQTFSVYFMAPCVLHVPSIWQIWNYR